jgi:putative SOS response-associated peptidase YedK
VILAPDNYEQWLDPKIEDKDVLQPLLRPCPDDWLAFRPVSTRVNNPRHDVPDCIHAVDVQGELFS